MAPHGLHGSTQALALLRRVLEVVLASGLFCESDGYYDYLHNGGKLSSEHQVTDEVAAKGLGEAGRLHIARSIWRRLIPRDLHIINT